VGLDRQPLRQLRYDNLFWNNALKDLGMASVRALGWNIGTVREMFGVLPAQASTARAAAAAAASRRRVASTPAPTRTARRLRVGARVAPAPQNRVVPRDGDRYGLAGAIYMYLRTGKRPTS
jgi:hypothetical protein